MSAFEPGELTEAEIAAGIAQLREVAARAIVALDPVRADGPGLDRSAVVWAEGYIERERGLAGPAQPVPEDLVYTLGAVVGESILAAADGAWVWDELQRDWCIALAAGGRVFPMGKVWRQYTRGIDAGESLVVFYDIVVDFLAKGKLPAGNV